MVSVRSKKRDNLKTHPLNRQHYQYVVNHMRWWDEMEIMLQGYTKKRMLDMFDDLHGVSATHGDIPVLCAGYQTFPNVYWYWFIATPMVAEHFVDITRNAQKMIEKNEQETPDARHIVQVWNKHQHSIKWLNILNFKQFSSFNVGNEQILLVERKRT